MRQKYDEIKNFPYRRPYDIENLSLIGMFLNEQTVLIICSVTGVIVGRMQRKGKRRVIKKWFENAKNALKNSSREDVIKNLWELSKKVFNFSVSFTTGNILWLVSFAISNSLFSPFISALFAQYWITALVIASRLVQIHRLGKERDRELDKLRNWPQHHRDHLVEKYKRKIRYEKEDIGPYFLDIGLMTIGLYIYTFGLPFIFSSLNISRCGYCFLALVVFLSSASFGYNCENQSGKFSLHLTRLLTLVFLGYVRFLGGVKLYNSPSFRNLYNSSYSDLFTKSDLFQIRRFKYWFVDRICVSLESCLYPHVNFEEYWRVTPSSDPTPIYEEIYEKKTRNFWSVLKKKVSRTPAVNLDENIGQTSVNESYLNISASLDVISEMDPNISTSDIGQQSNKNGLNTST